MPIPMADVKELVKNCARDDQCCTFFTGDGPRDERKDGKRLAGREMLLFVGCLTSQQHASVSQGRICSDNFTCCHTEIEVADHTFHLTQSQFTDTGQTSRSADSIMSGAWQGIHWSANF